MFLLKIDQFLQSNKKMPGDETVFAISRFNN